MSDTVVKPTRRAFLQRSVVIVPAVGLGAGAGLSACSTDPAPAIGDPAAAARVPVSAYTPRFFTEAEWHFVQAACARLIPEEDAWPGALTAGVPNFLDTQLENEYGHAARWYMQGPHDEDALPEMGFQSRRTPRETYRAAIAAIDQTCRDNQGAPFHALRPETQDAVLRAMEDGELAHEQVKLDAFFEMLLTNVTEGYLADPIHGGNHDMTSWKMLGFPGARADYVTWAPRLNEPYPLGPVSISGQRG